MIFLGNGDGTFQSPSGFSTDFVAVQLNLADINQDGRLDLLGIDGAGNLDVLLGKGDGTFLPEVAYSTLGNPVFFTTGDFNADGKLDVAVPNGSSQNIAMFYGNGDGTFQPAATIPAPSRVLGLASGDFNGDGRLDMYSPDGVQYLGTTLLQGNFPILSSAPGTLTFAAQGLNTTSAAQTVTLTNTGNAALSIAKIGLTGGNAADCAETNTCGASLAANASCQIGVTFTPTALGTRNAVLAISDNAPGNPQGITVTGVTTPVPLLTLSVTSVMFPAQYVGTSGLAQTVTLTNSGTATLTITNVATSSGDFGMVNACGSTLVAGASCSIGVFFDPMASGARSGTLTITNNASGSPQSIPLSGMGQDFSFSASSSSDTISPGQTATYTIAVNAIAGFNQAVALSCSGAPTGSTCSLSTASVQLSGSNPTAVTVSVTTVANSVRKHTGIAVYLALCGFPGILLLGLQPFATGRRQSKLVARWFY